MRVVLAIFALYLLAGCASERQHDDLSWRVLRDYGHHGHGYHEHWRR